MKKKTIGIVVGIIILGAITAKLIANKVEIDSNSLNKSDITTTVKVVNVEKRIQNSTLSITGVTAARQEVTLKSETGGQIVDINFNLGDFVSKGKSLVQIDDRLAKLSLESAKLNLVRSEDEYNKIKNLYNGDAATETTLRDAKIDYEKAKLSVEQAEKQLSFTKILATQSGYIVSKFVEKGTYLTSGTSIAYLVDISQLKVNIKAAEKDAYKIKVGQDVKISSSIFPDVIYNGKVSFVSQQGDDLHNYPVEILLENKSTSQLKAGTFVNVNFQFKSVEPSLLIPRESLVGSLKNAKVYTIHNNQAHLKDITVGRDFGNLLEVVSGLNENEKVVVAGQINLTDGATVDVIN